MYAVFPSPLATAAAAGLIALAGDLAGTGSIATSPRVSSVTGVASVVSVRSGSAVSFDGGATPAAAAGLIRLPNNVVSIATRNAANSADAWTLTTTNADQLFFNCSAAARISASGLISLDASLGITLNALGASSLQFQQATVTRLTVSSSTATFALPVVLQGTNPAGVGDIRAANATTIIAARNAANSADFAVIFTDASNNGWISGANAAVIGVAAVAKVTVTSTSMDLGPLTAVQLPGTNRAGSGDLRAANATTVLAARNAANSADLTLITTDSANTLTIGNAGGGNTRVAAQNTLAWQVAGTDQVQFTTTGFHFTGTGVTATIDQLQATAGSGATFTIQAQSGFGTGVTNGGTLMLEGGARNSTGNAGGVRIALNASNAAVLVEAADLGNMIRRVVAINRNAPIASADVPTGDLVTHIGNAAVVPSSNPVGGFVLYSDGGKFAIYGPAATSTQTTVGAAGAASVLPNNPLRYWKTTIDGTAVVIPVYNP